MAVRLPRGLASVVRGALVAALVVTGGAFIACGAHDSSAPENAPQVDPLPECEQYVTTYRACFGALGANAARLANERADALHDRYLVAARDELTRESTRQECAANDRQLHEACR